MQGDNAVDAQIAAQGVVIDAVGRIGMTVPVEGVTGVSHRIGDLHLKISHKVTGCPNGEHIVGVGRYTGTVLRPVDKLETFIGLGRNRGVEAFLIVTTARN